MDETSVTIVALCIVGWALVSRRFTRADITGPMVFVALGLILAHEPIAIIDVGVHAESVRLIAEITLAIALFSDASRVNLRALRRDAALPSRLLLIGLPLTIALGAVGAALLFSGSSLWVAALIAAAVAPTDAALGAAVVQDERVPARIRRVLNVESGLNDGIVTPFVFAFLAGALTGEASSSGGVAGALGDLGIGVVVGAALGLGVGLALGVASRHGWSTPGARPVAVVALALACYFLAVELDANGFIAAFVGGLAFGGPTGGDEELMRFSDEAGAAMSLVVWFLFGAAMLVPAFDHLAVEDVLFAALALSLVRMIPVALALVGSGLDRSTVAFVGWFGPRGLASVVFALIAYDQLGSADAQTVLPAISCTVVLSIIAHGISASPLSARYARHAESIQEAKPEHHPTPELRTRNERFR